MTTDLDDVFSGCQNEYLGLVEQCMNFACELMDLCRGTQEVEAVLSEGCEKRGSRDPLARLKMAVEYEEKKVNRLRVSVDRFNCAAVSIN